MAPHILPHLHVITFPTEASELYARLLGCPVHTVSPPHEAVTTRRNRAGTQSIVVSVLGQQQINKGYHLVPDIVQLLMAERPRLRFLIHDATPDAVGLLDRRLMLTAQQSLRALATADNRITLYEMPAGKDLWPSLLDRSDLVLCPYLPADYIDRYSGVARDAVANAIPLVGPAGTSIDAMIKEFGGVGTVFERPEAGAVAAAVMALVDNFDRYALRAHAAAITWPTRYGAKALVDAVLALVAPNA